MNPDYDALTAAYLILGNSLEKSGLLDEHWIAKKLKDRSAEDELCVELFAALSRYVMGPPLPDREAAALRARAAIDALEENEGNLVLSAAHLALIASSRMFGPSAKLIESRSTRVIDAIHSHVREVASEEIAIASYRIADNIDRRLSGRPMLDSSIRDAWKRRWAR